MFPGWSGSQGPFSPRDQSNLPVSDAQSNVGLLSQLEPVDTPEFAQNIIPGTGSHWPIQTPISAVRGGSQSRQESRLAYPAHHSTTALDTTPNQPHAPLSSNFPLTGSTAQSSIEDIAPIRQPTVPEDSRGLGISPYPMSAVSDSYFAGPMQQSSHQYAWANRPYQPMQSPPAHISPPFPSQPSYPSTTYPMGYPSQSGVIHGYQHQEPQLPGSYLSAPGNVPRHSQPRRNPSSARAASHDLVCRMDHPGCKRSYNLIANIGDSPPPYMMNQPAYYYPDTSTIQPHPTAISPQPPSMVAPEPTYSSPESAAPTDSDQPVRVLSSRPRPQCWDHGCNGREFSTFSNLLRHQREKSGVVAKAECPVCGAVFTRTTARNIHVAQGKCKSPGRESSAE
ncbi:uncharacterized protein N7515_005710 [Penicillium bovifimosum]|uniref:C2H2-type domain-containing protein n=1 Tax=Penicillium bovifimosum TaxID=126998 RepID=A0A9W9GUL9_9EURO|nr:uncharacterized protein N7515_005710 [Penicillium bovifimosum]KAJ5129671.1 hypothetical protein N7515_005710 [Penicillium bovifimosum]